MKLTSELDYKKAFVAFEQLVSEMGDNAEKQTQARALAELIQQYEQEKIHFPKPTTLTGMIELKMYEMKLKQKDVATLLGVNPSRISEILNGKKKITLEFAQKLHQELGIDGNFILEKA
ncbi:MAG: helix-turn-helix domain-containing protein [Spirosomataceae bacterium]